MTDTTSPHSNDRNGVFALLLLALSAMLAGVIFYPVHIIGSGREAVRAELARELLDSPVEAHQVIDIRSFVQTVFGTDLAAAYSLPASDNGSLICAASPDGATTVLYLDRLEPGPAGVLREAFPLDGLEDRMIRYCAKILDRTEK